MSSLDRVIQSSVPASVAGLANPKNIVVSWKSRCFTNFDVFKVTSGGSAWMTTLTVQRVSLEAAIRILAPFPHLVQTKGPMIDIEMI